MLRTISTVRIPIKLWLDDMEEGALQKLRDLNKERIMLDVKGIIHCLLRQKDLDKAASAYKDINL